jgi:HEAT repeat protein
VALRRFGADARAVPRLAEFLKPQAAQSDLVNKDDDSLARAAAETLTALGLEGRRAVAGFAVRDFRVNRDVNARLWALRDLAAIGPDAAPAVADLLALLADTREDMQRIDVVRVLEAIGPGASAAVTDLTALLADANNDLRTEVARALGAIGPGAQAALPALTRMADNRNLDVRQAACEALLKISPTGKGLGPALIAAVMNSDRACADRLASMLQRSADAPALRVRLTELAANDPDARVRITARRAAEFLVRAE